MWWQRLAGAALLAGVGPLLLLQGAAVHPRRDGGSVLRGGDGIIRLHVLANSDTPADQALKLKVRDAVVVAVEPRLARAHTRAEARLALAASREAIAAAARNALRQAGSDYPVRVEMGRFPFSAREAMGLVFPAGEYEAVKVVIGAGAGHNWWCVVFPPVCFAPATAARDAVTAFRLDDQPPPRLQVRSALADWWQRWRAGRELASKAQVPQ